MPTETALKLVGLRTGSITFRRSFPTASRSSSRSRAPSSTVLTFFSATNQQERSIPAPRLVLAAIQKVNVELGTETVVITHNSAIAGMADCEPWVGGKA
jgi:hypothetical protein